MPWTVTLALLVIGATGITGQLVLVRELLTVFLGNELSLGIILACWLALEALGSWLAGRLKPRLALFVAAVIVSLLAFPAAIWFSRVARPLFGFTPGETLSPLAMLLIAFLTLLPASFSHGALFTLCVGLNDGRGWSFAGAPVLGRVYVTETLGSILGGLLLSFLLIGRLGSFQIALVFAAVNSLMLLVIQARNAGAIAACALLAGSIVGLARGLPAALDHSSLARLYPGNQVVYYGDSHYGNITVLQRAGQYTVLSDGTPTVTWPAPDYDFAEEFVHIPMLSHPNPRDILLIGGVMNGLLPELLKYPDARIDCCELDPALIPIVHRMIPDLAATGLDDPRVSVRTMDGRRYLQGRPFANYDLVMVSVLSPTTLQTNRYFSREFFELVRRGLRPDGLLVLPAPGSLAYLNNELTGLNCLQLRTLRRVFPKVRVVPGEPNLLLASETVRPGQFEPEALAARLKNYGFSTRTVSPRYLTERLSAQRRVDFDNRIDAQSVTDGQTLNRDQQPIQVLASLSYWTGLTSPRAARWFSALIGGRTWLVLLLTVGLVIPILAWRRRIRFALRFAILSTGFAGAAASVMILLLFQIASGTMYLHLVLLTTAFMAGTALGGAWATPPLRKSGVNSTSLYRLEAGIALSTLAIVLLAPVFARVGQTATIAGYLVFAVVSGTLLGAEFPIISRLYLDSDRSSRLGQTAGNLYSADLFGGVLSSLLVPIILVPVIGMLSTALLIVLTKLVSLLLLHLSRTGAAV